MKPDYIFKERWINPWFGTKVPIMEKGYYLVKDTDGHSYDVYKPTGEKVKWRFTGIHLLMKYLQPVNEQI